MEVKYFKVCSMLLEIQATYENGVLKPDSPLPFQEHERVSVKIQTRPSPLTYGLIGWTGDPETLRRIALDPEFGVQEAP